MIDNDYLLRRKDTVCVSGFVLHHFMFSSIAGRLSISNVKFQSLNKKSYVEALTLKTLCLVETDAEYFIQYQYK